jgi:hypothetical protein
VRVIAPLRRYLDAPTLDELGASAVLRPAFVVGFMAQVVLAFLVAIVVRLLTSGVAVHQSSVLMWVLVGFAILETVFAAFAGMRLASVRGRRPALTATLVLATLYGSVTWFLALAFATEQRGVGLYALLLLVGVAYALGFLTTGTLAKAAVKTLALAPDAPGNDALVPDSPGHDITAES